MNLRLDPEVVERSKLVAVAGKLIWMPCCGMLFIKASWRCEVSFVVN